MGTTADLSNIGISGNTRILAANPGPTDGFVTSSQIFDAIQAAIEAILPDVSEFLTAEEIMELPGYGGGGGGAIVGEIRVFGIALPDGWLPCDGSLTTVDGPLYNLGMVNTPDIQGACIVGAGGTYSLGDTGGESEVTLTIPEMPAHDGHRADASAYTLVAGSGTLAKASVGGGLPHNNMPPYWVGNIGIYEGV
jgi:microcystin-dependent protein